MEEIGELEKITIVFLGATGFNKGIHNFESLIDQFGEKFRWATVGIEDYFSTNPLVSHYNYSYANGDDLDSILHSLKPAFVFLDSVVPETFSFTAHEALAACIPVITTNGSGNIASLVKESEGGLVFDEFDKMLEYLKNNNSALAEDLTALTPEFEYFLNTAALTKVYGKRP